MMIIIGRAADLTKGSIILSVIVDSGQPQDPAHAVPRYCFYSNACRMILNNGTVAISSGSQVTADSSCPNDQPVCTLAGR
jgi:hypothetical protein